MGNPTGFQNDMPVIHSKDDVLTVLIHTSNDYIIHRELATGKGFADLVLIPRKNVDSPAIPARWLGTPNNLLLVGITYDTSSKQHKCRIEKCS